MKAAPGSWGALLLGIALVPLSAGAQDFSNYRGFQLGSTIGQAAKQSGWREADLTTTHRRPALIQELEWRPVSRFALDNKKVDPVRSLTLRFYNGRLFQIISTYEADRIEGLTEGDLVDGISKDYGRAIKPRPEVPYHSNYGESAAGIARWEKGLYSCDLVRTGDRSSFALILSIKQTEAMAQAAIVESQRLDAIEAPQRAIDSQVEREAQDKAERNKARTTNLPNFQP